MDRIVMALVSLAAAGCAGSQTQPSGRVRLVVTLGASSHPAVRHYTLRCGPAGGTMPDADTACGVLADYVKHRDDRGRMCSGLVPRTPSALVAGTFAGHRLHLQLTRGSWCGSSTTVFRYANQHPYSKGIAPERCLRASG
jgi:hypothetical protein